MAERISLDRLYAFECAARHLSFRHAAKELHVSPAAVGQRIRALEEDLGTDLFVRRTRQITLTAAGEALLTSLQKGLASIHQGLEKVRTVSAKPSLTITTTVTFAECFLLVHLSTFQQKHPDLNVRVLTSDELVDLQTSDAQVAVRFGPGGYTGCKYSRLLEDEYIAVAAPSIVGDDSHWFKQYPHITTHWVEHPATPPLWSDWYGAKKIREPATSKTVTVNIESHALRAAVHGQGIALVHALHAHEAISFGQLVSIDPSISVTPKFSYWLVHDQVAADPAIAAFCDWLKDLLGSVQVE